MSNGNDKSGRVDIFLPRSLAWPAIITGIGVLFLGVWQAVAWIQAVETRIGENGRDIATNAAMIIAVNQTLSRINDDKAALERAIAVLNTKMDAVTDDIAATDARVGEVVRLMNILIQNGNGRLQ